MKSLCPWCLDKNIYKVVENMRLHAVEEHSSSCSSKDTDAGWQRDDKKNFRSTPSASEEKIPSAHQMNEFEVEDVNFIERKIIVKQGDAIYRITLIPMDIETAREKTETARNMLPTRRMKRNYLQNTEHVYSQTLKNSLAAFLKIDSLDIMTIEKCLYN